MEFLYQSKYSGFQNKSVILNKQIHNIVVPEATKEQMSYAVNTNRNTQSWDIFDWLSVWRMTLNIFIYVLQYWNPGRSIHWDFSIYPDLYTRLQICLLYTSCRYINQ